MTNFDTVREAMHAMSDGKYPETMKQALAALAEIERLTGEPVAGVYRHGKDSHGREWHGIHWYDPNLDVPTGTKLYTTAPPAQQPQAECWACNGTKTVTTSSNGSGLVDEPCQNCAAQQPRQCGLCGADEAFTGTCGGGKNTPNALCYEPVAQQPQAEPTTLTNAFLADVMTAAGLVSHGKQCKALGERLGAEVARLRTAAPQQAESVPPGFVIVPVEPTDAMWNAMKDYGTKKSEWRAILAAAPKAEAVPLLSEKEIVKCLTAAGCVGTIKMSYDSGPYEITRTSINADRFARAIEQAARAKMGAGVPMTHAERTAALVEQYPDNDCPHMWSFLDGIRAAEKFHGIVGKDGGNDQ